ncbi:MAG TPA: hypothetical protein VGC95_07460 [Chitinophagaceae bacterium]
MAINKNHEFEELNGTKCAVVERNASSGRVAFLKSLLEFNGYTVVVAQPVAKPASPRPAVAGEPVAEVPLPPAEEKYTVGVTDVAFNPTNALFGRMLRTPDGHVVTPAYWQQKEERSNDEVPYFDKKN